MFKAISIEGVHYEWNTNDYSLVKKSFKSIGVPAILILNNVPIKETGCKNKYFSDTISSYLKYLEIFKSEELAYNNTLKLVKAWVAFGFNIGFDYQIVLSTLKLFYTYITKEEEA